MLCSMKEKYGKYFAVEEVEGKQLFLENNCAATEVSMYWNVDTRMQNVGV